MKQATRFRQKIENNGLVLIALVMITIYWVFDFLSSGHYLTRTLIAVFVIIYGVFTQTLINSRQAALEEKEKAQQKLVQSEKMAALGRVAAGVAHEVKNPLAIIVQGIAFLKTVLSNDARLLDAAGRIEKSALRADNIIKGLLSFSREVPLKMEETDIGPVIDETLSFIDHQIRQKNIHVKRLFASDLPKIIMDSNQIKQVFTNLFMNAIEAMQEGGILGIQTEQKKDKTDQIYVRVLVSDTGEGIPEDGIHRIFDPFFTTKNTAGNTGLGLSITKGIIDKHHGTIEIESEPGRGTRVMVGLPAGLV
ncbi:MAG: GHKL domain-containing protein [Deltaproteobacteria bacterium]|nr:GHKL domain-containing protein [Deltaproteobacteria bacterium]